MMSISLGPLALPVLPFLLLAAIWLAAALAARQMRRELIPAPGSAHAAGAADPALPVAAESAVWWAAILGLLAARLAYVALNANAYAATPVSVLDIRDGGWWAPAGWLAGAAWLVRCGLRRPALHRALAKGAVVMAVFALALLATQLLRVAARMPDTPLLGMVDSSPTTLQQAAAGRPVVVNLWATWCAPCRAEMPMLAGAQQREDQRGQQGGKSVAFIFVNQGEAAQTVQRYMAREGLPLRNVLLDALSAMGPAVGSQGLPTTLFYDAQGRQVDAHFGMLNAAALESRLQKLRNTP
jgi:thiol-disulfide isomerase/thioredoxin